MSDESYSRLLIFMAGLIGAAGVVMAAGAAHGGPAQLLAPAAAMCLVHAPALLALDARRPRPAMFTLASALLGGGTLLFAGDLAIKASEGHSVFPLAAPIGGTLLILGWISVALAAFAPTRRRQSSDQA